MADSAISDPVPQGTEGAREIGFAVPGRYNASELLFRNLDTGRSDKVAVFSPSGNATYGELCAAQTRSVTRSPRSI